MLKKDKLKERIFLDKSIRTREKKLKKAKY
jgi:hypothetical protein